MKDHLDHQDHQAFGEIQEALEILENQDHMVCQEAWGTWVCQVLKEKEEL